MAFKIFKNNEKVKENTLTDVFVGRKEEIEIFLSNYEYLRQNYNKDESKVLVYYGFSDMGKTYLCKRLMRELDDKRTIYYDFRNGVGLRAFMESSIKDMKQKYGYSFLLYDYAFYLCERKRSSSNLEKCIQESSFLKYLVKNVGFVPEVDIVQILLEYANNDDVVIRKFLNKYRQDINNIEMILCDLNENEIDTDNILLTCYEKDFIHNQEYEDVPFVIFLDSYEMMINTLNSEKNTLDSDKWLRSLERNNEGILLMLPNVLWVIASREKLKWRRFDSIWNHEALEQHELEIFSEDEALELLRLYGVEDIRKCIQLHKLTQGNPKHLALCAKTISEQPELTDRENIKIHYNTLFDDFTENMDFEIRNALLFINKLLIWTDKSYEEKLQEDNVKISQKIYNRIKSSGYVFAETNYRYEFEPYLSEIMSRTSYEFLNTSEEGFELELDNEEIKTEYSDAKKTEENDDVKESNQETEEKHELQIVGATALVNSKEFLENERINKKLTILEEFKTNALDVIGNSLLRSFREKTKNEMKLNSNVSVKLYNSEKNELQTLDDAKKSVEFDEEVLEHNTIKNDIEVNDNIEEDENIIDCEIKEDAKKNVKSVMDIADDLILYDKDTEELEIYINENVDVLSLEEIYNDTHEKFENMLDENKFDLFENIFPTVWKRVEKEECTKEYILFSRIYMLYLNKSDKMDIASKKVDIDEINDKYEEYDLHPKEAIELEGLLSIAYFHVDKFQKAVEIEKKSYKKRMQELGEKSAITLKSLYAQAVLYHNMGRNVKALNINVESYAKAREILGDDHEDTLANLDNLGDIYMETDMFEGALNAKRTVYDKYSKLYGKENSRVLKCLCDIGKIYMEMDKLEKSEKVLNTVLERMTEKYGKNNKKVLSCMSVLRECRERLKLEQEDEADLFSTDIRSI